MVYLFHCLYNECLSVFSFPLGNCPIYLVITKTIALPQPDRMLVVCYTTKLCSVSEAKHLHKTTSNEGAQCFIEHAIFQTISMGVSIT